MPKYDPWNNKRRGFARNDAPAFQRAWQSFDPSAVALNGDASQRVIEPPSSTLQAASGTVYIWGFSFATPSTAARGGVLKDDDGNPIGAAVGTCNGPFFLNLSTPIKLPKNSGVSYEKVGSHTANSYLTPYYVIHTEPTDTPVT